MSLIRVIIVCKINHEYSSTFVIHNFTICEFHDCGKCERQTHTVTGLTLNKESTKVDTITKCHSHKVVLLRVGFAFTFMIASQPTTPM